MEIGWKNNCGHVKHFHFWVLRRLRAKIYLIVLCYKMSFVRSLRFAAFRPTPAGSFAPARLMSVTTIPTSSSSAATTRPPASPLSFPSVNSIFDRLINELADGIMLLKRTFQPSLMRRKRKHGFLSRLNDRNGRKVLNRRLEKGRRQLSA